jgi:hypothetical protein
MAPSPAEMVKLRSVEFHVDGARALLESARISEEDVRLFLPSESEFTADEYILAEIMMDHDGPPRAVLGRVVGIEQEGPDRPFGVWLAFDLEDAGPVLRLLDRARAAVPGRNPAPSFA